MNEQAIPSTKHFKSFWPLTIIAVLAIAAGGLIMWSSFNQQLDDEVLSIIFGPHKTAKNSVEKNQKVQTQKPLRK